MQESDQNSAVHPVGDGRETAAGASGLSALGQDRNEVTPALTLRSNPLFQLPWFALELDGIRRPVIQISRQERDDLVPL